MEIADYFNNIRETVKSVLIKNPELKVSGKGREVLIEVQKIFPNINPDTVLRASRQLRSPKDKDFHKEQEWRDFFKKRCVEKSV